MAFFSQIFDGLPRGVPGDIANYGPHRGTARMMNSDDPANNVFGRFFTLDADGHAQAGGEGAFGGILIHSKEHVSYGTDNFAYGARFSIPNGVVGTLMEMGCVFIQLPEGVNANEGDTLNYDTTTGVIGVGMPGTGEAAIPNAVIYRGNVEDGAIAIVKLTN